MKSSKSVIHFETQRDNKTRWVKQAQLEDRGLADWITDTLNQRCYDYNVRAIKGRVDKPRDAVSGRALAWLQIAAMIAARPVNSTEICQVLEISRNSFVRHLADMERIYGFVAEYVRPDGRKPGWYEIRDWGILNEQRVIKQYREPGSGASPGVAGEDPEA